MALRSHLAPALQAPASEDYISSMPAELILEIAAYLSPKDVARFAKTSHVFHSTITRYERSISKPVIDYHKARLKHAATYLDFTNLRVDIALHRYYQIFGFCSHVSRDVRSLENYKPFLKAYRNANVERFPSRGHLTLLIHLMLVIDEWAVEVVETGEDRPLDLTLAHPPFVETLPDIVRVCVENANESEERFVEMVRLLTGMTEMPSDEIIDVYNAICGDSICKTRWQQWSNWIQIDRVQSLVGGGPLYQCL